MQTYQNKVLLRLMILTLAFALLLSGNVSADQYRADEAYGIVNSCRVTLLNCRDVYKRRGTLSDRTIELMYYTAKMLVASWNIAQIQEKDQEPTIVGHGEDPDILNEGQIDAKWKAFLRGTIDKEAFIEDLIDYCWNLLQTKHAPLIGDAPEDGSQEEDTTEGGADSADKPD